MKIKMFGNNPWLCLCLIFCLFGSCKVQQSVSAIQAVHVKTWLIIAQIDPDFDPTAIGPFTEISMESNTEPKTSGVVFRSSNYQAAIRFKDLLLSSGHVQHVTIVESN